MSKIIIYGAGLVVVAFVVGLLLLLTFDNVISGQAVFGTRWGVFAVNGPASVFVNAGIVGAVGSLILYVSFLFSRKSVLYRAYQIASATSVLAIFIGLIWGQS